MFLKEEHGSSTMRKPSLLSIYQATIFFDILCNRKRKRGIPNNEKAFAVIDISGNYIIRDVDNYRCSPIVIVPYRNVETEARTN